MIGAEAREHLGELGKRVKRLQRLAIYFAELGLLILTFSYALPGVDISFNQGFAGNVIVPLELDTLARKLNWAVAKDDLTIRQWGPAAFVVAIMLGWRVFPFLKKNFWDRIWLPFRIHISIIAGAYAFIMLMIMVSQLVIGGAYFFVPDVAVDHAHDRYKIMMPTSQIGTKAENEASFKACLATGSRRLDIRLSSLLGSTVVIGGEEVSMEEHHKRDCEKKSSSWHLVEPSTLSPELSDITNYFLAQHAYLSSPIDEKVLYARLSGIRGIWLPNDSLHRARLGAMAELSRAENLGPLPPSLMDVSDEFRPFTLPILIRSILVPIGLSFVAIAILIFLISRARQRMLDTLIKAFSPKMGPSGANA